jgi:fatty-acyl-CoA synthase
MTNIAAWIGHHAAWRGDRTALRFHGRDISYAAFDARIAQLAGFLRERLKIAEGDRVAYLGHNRPDLLELLFACARIGAILVPLNWRLAVPEHAWILANCTPGALFADPAYWAQVADHPDAYDSPHLVPVGGTPADGNWRIYAADAGPTAAPPLSSGGDAPVLLVYTSGTTGQPKGALLSHDALFYNALNSVAAHDLTSRDRILTALPMFHVGGMNIHTTPALYAGAAVTLLERFEPGTTLKAIAEDRPTIFLAVPAVISALTAHPDWPAADLSSLRLVGTGSSNVPEALLRAWIGRGIPATQIYGLTESCPVAVCLPVEDAERRIGSAGKPAIHCQARIAGDDGRTLPPGERGEIMLRGPNLFSGYWQDEAATGEAFSDGWFHTGDIGHTDADGFFYVDDRKKDVIISGGENIYPAELENVLADCPAIAEAAVVGQADDKWGEVAVACVVAAAGTVLTEHDVRALFDGRLARFKHPRRVLFMDNLPRNAMGKILKFELRDRLTA